MILMTTFLVAVDRDLAMHLQEKRYLLDDLEKNFSDQEKAVHVRYLLILWNEIVRQKNVKQKAGKDGLGLKFYDLLLETDPESENILKKSIPEDILSMTVSLISQTSLGFNTNESILAKRLKDDLDILSKKHDFNYVNQLLVPLLKSEDLTAVCFSLYNHDTEEYIPTNSDSLELLENSGVSNFMKGSKILRGVQLREVDQIMLAYVAQNFNAKKLQISKWNC
jgi:hypothetical protein